MGEVPDGSGRMYVPDLNGKLYLVERGTPHVYLDVGAAFAPVFFSGRGLGQGFGFVAFHPEFRTNGKFYTVHAEAGEAVTTKIPDLPPQPGTIFHGVVTEWTAADPAASTFRGTHREVLRLGFGGQIHGIQQISFNPTARRGDEDYGLLYIAAGEGGRGVASDDPQNLALPHGKILRIDPQGKNGANGRYGIPPSNPFVGKPRVLGEIFAYGMRDPHRFSWDTGGRHRMLLGHIGEHAVEAVYDVRAGDNLGWSEREGPFVFDKKDPCHYYGIPKDDATTRYDYPVAAYTHDPPPDWPCTEDSGHAVSGGFVYRGRAVPELSGKYLFGDIVDGRLFYANEVEMRRGQRAAPIYELALIGPSGRRMTLQDLAGDKRVDLHFGCDRHGEIYLLSKANGTIWRITGARRFADCAAGGTTVSGVAGATNWAPVTPGRWRFEGGEVILAEAGTPRTGPRRPFEYAVLTAGPELGSVHIEAEVRIDTPVEVTGRDVIVVFGYQSDTRFYYVHLSTDNTIYPHNGIFVVNDADRRRIDDQWNANRSRGAVPAIADGRWHHVRVVRCAETGYIAVYVDRSKTPLMTAVDTTFASGRVGFGSFDDVGRLRGLSISGTAAR
jgi:glucose/arabinose dehydrogenase